MVSLLSLIAVCLAATTVPTGARTLQTVRVLQADGATNTTATPSTSSGTFSGDGTAYSDSVPDGKGFACSYRYLNTWAQSNFAAMNAAQWDDGQACGKCVSVQCIDPKCTVQNKPVTVMIVDKCPECAHGALDLSYPVYKQVTGLWPNRLKVSWSFTDCAEYITGTIKIDPKDGVNPYWSAYYISNTKYPLKSVTINGVALTRQTYNFWVYSAPLGPAPHTVVMEAVNGQKLTATSDNVLKSQDLGVQFQDGGAPVASAG